MRAGLVAMAKALRCVSDLLARSSALITSILLCTDSLSGLQVLSRGPNCQQTVLSHQVWTMLHKIANQGKTIILQCVLGHADIDGNETANRIANHAAATCDQVTTPVDLPNARTAIRRWVAQLTSRRARQHPHPHRTPGHDDLYRWGQTTISQLRTGHSILVRATLHRIGLATDPLCRECGEEEDVGHLLTSCPHTPPPGAGYGGSCPSSRRCSPDR